MGKRAMNTFFINIYIQNTEHMTILYHRFLIIVYCLVMYLYLNTLSYFGPQIELEKIFSKAETNLSISSSLL